MKTSEEVLETFLRFFESRNHLRIPSASLIPKDDPTLLFVNSGMAPLKPYFLGQQKPPQPNLCNIQPCIRTVDIDIVGDRHHLTLFEMLGSWSIGEYWKDRAIELAYDLLVNHFAIDPAKLYASVYSGDASLGIPADDESAAAWERVGMPRDHIVHLGEDNFWGPAGKYGPCGPCTEVFYDTGEAHGPTYVPGGVFDTGQRYIEIWNAGVFMEFDKQPTGLAKLALRSVDTGSGLERMVMNLNRLESVYDTDRLKPLLDAIQQQLGDAADPGVQRDSRIIADHFRAISFMVSDGAVPANIGRGYIPRRLIRKCVALTTRRGVPSFDIEGPLDVLITSAGKHYPRLTGGRARILETFEAERRAFALRLDAGLERLATLGSQTGFRLSGPDALSLFATFGLPLDVIRDVVREHGGELDEASFQEEFSRHQEVSRGAAESAAAYESLDLLPKTTYVGEETLTGEGRITALFVGGEPRDTVSAGETVEVIVDRTPFYAESGGQIGDRGQLAGQAGTVDVTDTVKRRDIHVSHVGRVVSGSLAVGSTVELRVNAEDRRRIRASHSATHLLQSALRTVLGPHVRQSGSRVEPGRFRFDFQHGEKLTPEQRRTVELMVNEFVSRNVPAVVEQTTYQDAVSRGALAFFGDTYGAMVRMVQFEGVSTELCGGSHVRATGDIGTFRIVAESSVGSGVRRLVAATGQDAVLYGQQQEAILESIAGRLHVAPDGVDAQVSKLLERATKPASSAAAPAASGTDAIRNGLQALPDGTPYVVAELDVQPQALREAALDAADWFKAVVCLVSRADDKTSVVVTVAKTLTARFNAHELLATLMPLMDGRGGGKPHLAQGGGRALPDVAPLQAAFEHALSRLVAH